MTLQIKYVAILSCIKYFTYADVSFFEHLIKM